MVVKYSQDLFGSFINSPYELNLLKNPSELIRKISSDVEISISYIFLIILILKEILILLAIFSLLFFTKTNVVILILLDLEQFQLYFISQLEKD